MHGSRATKHDLRVSVTLPTGRQVRGKTPNSKTAAQDYENKRHSKHPGIMLLREDVGRKALLDILLEKDA